MYSRDFGIKSEGQLYNLEQEYNSYREEVPPVSKDIPPPPPPPPEPKKGFGLDFLRDLKLDDLILIGIGILLLLDSDSENDIWVFIIAFLLLS